MIEYATTSSGLRLGLFVHHTDAEREYAYDRESHVGKIDRALDEAQEGRFLPGGVQSSETYIPVVPKRQLERPISALYPFW